VTSRTQTKPRTKKPRLNRAEKREANRARILTAARTVFGDRGFHGATIEEIADEAGLSNGAIYYNFDSKSDLFFELLKERTDERVRHLRATIEARAGKDAPEHVLDAEAADATRSLKESGEWRLLVFEFVAHASRNPELASRLREHKRSFKKAFAEVLEQGLGGGRSKTSIAPETLALTATALANGLAAEEIEDPGSVPDELLGEVLAAWVKGARR
jgi:AcrR family transcriptional regulator